MNKNVETLDSKKDYKSLGILIVIAVVIVVLLVLIFKTLMGGASDAKKLDIEKVLDKKQTTLIYVENSDKGKCKDCSKMKSYLDEKKINYIDYDEKQVDSKEYDKLLSSLNIDKDLFGYPAVIYINEGVMYANIINITETSVIDQFIKDYDLTKVKKLELE